MLHCQGERKKEEEGENRSTRHEPQRPLEEDLMAEEMKGEAVTCVGEMEEEMTGKDDTCVGEVEDEGRVRR